MIQQAPEERKRKIEENANQKEIRREGEKKPPPGLSGMNFAFSLERPMLL
jgi:hypothetical protein